MDKDRNKNIKYILIGVGCALPVVMMVTIILASADSVFRNMIVKIFKLDTLILNLTGIVIMIIVSYALAYAFSFYVKNGKVYINEKENKMAALPVNIIMSMVAVVYVMFADVYKRQVLHIRNREFKVKVLMLRWHQIFPLINILTELIRNFHLQKEILLTMKE